MAADQSPLDGDVLGDIQAWMERRKAEVGQFARDAEAAGRQAWNEATRASQDVSARTQGELAVLGASRLQRSRTGAAPSPNANKPAAGSWLDQSPAAKAVGGNVAELAGNAAGLGRGALDSAKGLGQGLLFTTRLLDPDDAEIYGADNSAWGQVFNAGKGAVDYVREGIAEPAGVANDFRNLSRQLYVNTVPNATPVATTFGGEMARNFNLGRNEGELDWDIGSLLFGGAASKTLRGLGSNAEADGAAKFLAQGFSPSQAGYLAGPYKGMGHHFVPRSVARTIGAPPTISDSALNVLKPKRMSRGDFYALHYRVDPQFHTANLPRSVGRGTWKGKALGLQKYGPWGRIWHGSPAPLNAAVGAMGAAGLTTYKPAGGAAR